MPLYVFRCPACQRVEERLQKFDDPPPACLGRQVEHGNYSMTAFQHEPELMERQIEAPGAFPGADTWRR